MRAGQGGCVRKLSILAILVAAVVLRCGSSKPGTGSGVNAELCKGYVPGQILSFEEYEKKIDAIGIWRDFSYQNYEAYLAAVEREATPALFHFFSRFQTDAMRVWYGGFSKDLGDDDGKGFRVIGRTNLPDAAGKNRLAIVIMFWTYRNGKLQLKGGPDSLRVRVQTGPDVPGSAGYGKFLGVSYQVDVSPDGTVTSLSPSRFYNPDRSVRDNLTAAVPANGGHGCFFCHPSGLQLQMRTGSTVPLKPGVASPYDLRDDVIDETRVTPATAPSIAQFLAWMPPEARTPELEASFRTPKTTFLPKGIVSALQGRCDTLSR